MKNTFWIEGGVAWVRLNHGQKTCIDVADLPLIAPFKWRASLHRSGYRAVTDICKRRVFMHRFLAGVDGLQVDHRSGDSLNNRRHNLRDATHFENQRNRGKNRNNTSGFKGVSMHKASGLWRSSIMAGRQQRHLGYFGNPRMAAWVYNMVAVQLHGAFAKLNVVMKLSSPVLNDFSTSSNQVA